MSLHWKMRTNFPFSKVFVLGIILSLLGLVSMIISIIAFVTQSWGHYAGTGMWGGSIILACGLTAVFVSQLRSLTSVKTFCVFSFISVFTSFIMLILSAGGLSLNSRFYSQIGSADYNKRASVLIHASLLVNSLFCLIGSILAVIVCCKYLVFEHHDKSKCQHQTRSTLFGTIRTPSAARGSLLNSSSSVRSPTNRTPITTNASSRRHSDNVGNRVQIEYWRCHKHSPTDQPQTNSHIRRQRHSHVDSRNNNTNLLSPCGVHDKRVGNSRTSSQGRESRGDNKENERLNIIPLTQVSSRPFSQVQIQPRLSRNPVTTTSPLIHLPTEFDEEELPPYEAVQAASNVITGSQSDSGDESDTENSSSTDAQSYNAAAHGEDEANTAPLIEIQNSCEPERQCNKEQLKTKNCMSLCEHHSNITSSPKVPDGESTSAKQTYSARSSSDHKKDITNEISCTEGTAAVIMRKDSRRPNRLVLSYVHTRSLHPKENKRQLSLSPKLIAVTGDSVEPAQKKDVRVPHLVQENFYENGPSYENLKCAGINVNMTGMNHLSKPSSSIKTSTNAITSSKRDKETHVKSSTTEKKTAINTGCSPVSNTSPQLQQSGFGSTISAFRPVCAPSSTLSPHGSCSSSPLFHTNDDNHSQNNNVNNDKETENSSQIYVNTSSPNKKPDSASKSTSKYIEQGAIPKSAKHIGDINISWKNIQPLSYNHFESASNESEKKLPSKMIPFTDSKLEISSTSLKQVAPSKSKLSSKPSPHVTQLKTLVSSTVPSSSVLTLKSLALPVSLFGAGVEASVTAPEKLNNNIICDTADVHPQQVSTSSAAVFSNIPMSLVREASTQVNSISTSRWHSRRMGGNQTLLQSRQDELQNSQINHSAGETSTRPIRPSSMQMSGGFSVICHGISGLAADRQSRNRSSEASTTNSTLADSTNPQPLNSYLANHTAQQPQSLALRQNHLLQHYPLQPQQPRLGVQLHQRRQQQHQLQQNIESQQQHQQLQQQLQQPQPGNQQNVQSRTGRPLFSVLL